MFSGTKFSYAAFLAASYFSSTCFFTSIILSVTSFSAFAKTEVVWWDLLGGGDGVRMASLIEAFERDNPDIDIVNSTLEWGPPYYAKLQTSAAIGEQPDIAIYHISRYQMCSLVFDSKRNVGVKKGILPLRFSYYRHNDGELLGALNVGSHLACPILHAYS